MKTTVNHTKNLLLLSGLLLVCPSGALARDIPIEYVTVSVSSISPAPTAADTITIKNGGTLWVDQDATVGKITLGDDTTAGIIKFDGTPRILTVTDSIGQPGDVLFGANAGNVLDISYLGVIHTLKVAGAFIPSGAGSFIAGMGTVVFNRDGAQTVTAKIGANTIQYKNLRLSGSGPGNVKTLGDGVAVQGQLTVQGTATLAGSTPITYGSLASLLYKGGSAQTASDLEFLPVMPVPVIIENPAGVTLNSDKVILTPDPIKVVLTIVSGCKLYDGGKSLTVHGNIQNDGAHSGPGKIVLAGSVAQTLSGASTYGNLVLNNVEGATFADITTISGRLTVEKGKLTLPEPPKLPESPVLSDLKTHSTVLLTYGGADKAVFEDTYYGSSASVAPIPPLPSTVKHVKDDTVFEPTFKGLLKLTPKPAATIACENIKIFYGESEITVEGNILGGDNGNTSQSGETVTITVGTDIPMYKTTTTTGLTPSFSVKFPSATIPVGIYNIRIGYAGGINLAAVAEANVCKLIVKQRLVVVLPRNMSKIYGEADPILAYDLLDPFSQYDDVVNNPPVFIDPTTALRNGDTLLGLLVRGAGENIGAYAISQGTLNIYPVASRPNYRLEVLSGPALTIITRPVKVAAHAKTKIFGEADPDLTYSLTTLPPLPSDIQALVPGDVPTGGLSRSSGINVGTYAINIGSLKITTPGFTGNNYHITFESANLVITKKTIWVVADDKEKVYGAANPTLTFKTPSETSPPAFSGSLTRVPGETVPGSPYAITQGTLTAGGNYNITFTDGKLTILKRDVTISAVDTTKVYGQPNPKLVNYVFQSIPLNLLPPQETTTTPATIGNWDPSEATEQSVPGTYKFRVNRDAADPNHNIIYTALGGNLKITKAPLRIAADDKTKIANGDVFNPVNFSVSYSGFLPWDNFENSFLPPALLEYNASIPNTAVTATTPGTYVIRPQGLKSDKYIINADTWVDGRLLITGPLSTTSTWPTDNKYDWQINQADGVAGGPFGWSRISLSDPLVLPSDPFVINLITLEKSSNPANAAGKMARFDPTRPYSWTFIQAPSITGLEQANFKINPHSFANKFFDGKFAIVQTDSRTLAITFTPLGAPGNPVPDSFSVGTLDDLNSLLGYVTHSDIDTLYLQPSTGPGVTLLAPTEKLTIDLNIANIQQKNIVGLQAFIQFNSQFFNATEGTPDSPVVVGGGGSVWGEPIYKMWYVGGELDMVIGVNLEHANGTKEDGTVAKITLTPTRTAVGSSRVVFRQDKNLNDPGMAQTESTLLLASDNTYIYPARVMTDLIVIADNQGPVVNVTAYQEQPYKGNVNVKEPLIAGTDIPVNRTVRGTVKFEVDAIDTGVGLRTTDPVTLVLTDPEGSSLSLTPVSVDGSIYKFEWNVDRNTLNTKDNKYWVVTVSAYDNFPDTDIEHHKVTTVIFKLDVNKNEITGIVELDGFRGTQRNVTFTTGPNTKNWPYLPLQFVYTPYMEAGAFSRRHAFAQRLGDAAINDTLSAYLRFGSIDNLPALAAELMQPTRNVSAYVRALLFGDIKNQFFPLQNLTTLAYKLANPSRAVDVYIQGRLSPTTIAALNDYQNAAFPKPEDKTQALKSGLLTDFNAIVLGEIIYQQTRFESVSLSPGTSTLLDKPNKTAEEIILLNRYLLRDVYPEYIIGQLSAQAAALLAQYDGTYNPALVWYLLGEFDTLTLPENDYLWHAPSLYEETRFLGVTLRQATVALLEKVPFPTGTELTLLNRMLLEDAFAGMFTSGALTPDAVVVLFNYLQNSTDPAAIKAFDTKMVTDLNKLITGKSIWDEQRFAGIYVSDELKQDYAPGTDASIRVNRLLMEAAYPIEISKNVLARYILTDVPENTTSVSARTAWNLRETLRLEPPVSANNPDGIAYFVNDGEWQQKANGVFIFTDNNHKLRAGDIARANEPSGDNVINLIDYNTLKMNWPTTASPNGGPAADLNGDGKVNNLDYGLLKLNYGTRGD